MLRRAVFRRAEERAGGFGAPRCGAEEEGVSGGWPPGRVPHPLLGSQVAVGTLQVLHD